MTDASARRRPVVARIGLVLLNIFPGLGLVRLDDHRGLWWLLASTGLSLAFYVGVTQAPVPTFAPFAVVVGISLLLNLLLLIGSIVGTWRRSAVVLPRRHWWSRWYGIVGLVAAMLPIGAAEPDINRDYYRSFYIPAEAMLPTLQVNDRMLVDMRDHRARRGDIVLFRHAQGELYIKRVVAVAGDTVAMRGGVPVVNGHAVGQQTVGSLPVVLDRPRVARRLREVLPGGRGAHEVLDTATTAQDDTDVQTVPPGHVFVLGDNRDNSEDSRFPVATGGVGMLPLTAIRGHPLFIFWSRDRSRIGMPLGG